MNHNDQSLVIHCLIFTDSNLLIDTQALTSDWCEHLNNLECFKSRNLKWVPLSEFEVIGKLNPVEVECRYWWMIY